MEDDNTEGAQGAAGDPAQAFEALRAEVAGLARMLEAVGGRLSDQRPIDYTPTLEEFAASQQAVASRLAKIEKHPALNLTAKQLQAEIAMASTELMSEAVRQVREASGRISQEASQMQSLYHQVDTHRNQRRRLAWSTAAALVIGILLSPFLARLLPLDLDTRVAGIVLHQDRWRAGAQLMALADPDGYRRLQSAADLLRANHLELDKCREAVKETKKSQRCTINVSAGD